MKFEVWNSGIINFAPNFGILNFEIPNFGIQCFGITNFRIMNFADISNLDIIILLLKFFLSEVLNSQI